MEAKVAEMLNEMMSFVYASAQSIAESALVTFSGDGYSAIWSAVVQIANNIIEPIAVMIVVTMFLLSLTEKVSNEQFTLEHVLRDVIKLCLGLYLVGNSVEIVVGCIELGNGILNQAINNGILAPPSNSAWSDAITGDMFVQLGNFVLTIIMMLVFIIFMLVELIIIFVMKAICMVRVLEIAIRTAMSPLALSDTFAGNLLNSHAISFIRSFGGLCLQGVFITTIAYFVPVFWAGVFTDAVGVWGIFGGMFEMFLVSIAGLILMFKSGSIAKEMLGGR